MNDAALPTTLAILFLCVLIAWLEIRADRRERRHLEELEARFRTREGPFESNAPEPGGSPVPWLRRIPKEKPVFLNDAHEASLEARGEGGRDR